MIFPKWCGLKVMNDMIQSLDTANNMPANFSQESIRTLWPGLVNAVVEHGKYALVKQPHYIHLG